ncbi:hypothetical protein GGX14DRAFT_698211 [Mycena pura]|uniref:Uncharacterized protein n=1 Tax=Mycena pura TaxID=153505 RepID=A0AAD6VER4_9AGAR|nr:hypothetical protein GGX14DRAFT_698211 [Mycena pura]
MNRSKILVFYVAPVVALTSFLLFLFAYIAPVKTLHTGVAMLTVHVTQNSSDPVDGPSASVYIGALGSCSRATNDTVSCTSPSLNPVYDLSSLPTTAPRRLLSAPPLAAALFGLALTHSIVFFLFFTLVSYRHKLGEKSAATLDTPAVQGLLVWIGVTGFVFGIESFVTLRIWFGKAANDFNLSTVVDGPQLTATVGNVFIMLWVAYGFYGVLLVIAMMKYNVKTSQWTDF